MRSTKKGRPLPFYGDTVPEPLGSQPGDSQSLQSYIPASAVRSEDRILGARKKLSPSPLSPGAAPQPPAVPFLRDRFCSLRSYSACSVPFGTGVLQLSQRLYSLASLSAHFSASVDAPASRNSPRIA